MSMSNIEHLSKKLIVCDYYKPYFDTLKLLISRFYELEGCGAGGPLHILTDDDNYDIGSVQFCIDYCFKDLKAEKPDNPAHVNLLGIMIANEYAKMSLEERAVFDSYWCGVRVPTYNCPGNCDECELLGETYEHMKEAEEVNNDQN